MFYLIIRFTAFVLSKLLFRLQVYGRENIPRQGGFILASNHKSYLDPPLLAAACPRILHFVAKEGLFKNIFMRLLITNLNAFPIKTHRADLGALRRALKELKAGNGLIIFPEGGRIEGEELGRPERGIGFLAAKTSVPVVPAFIQDTEQALPMHSKFIRLKQVKVYFGRPIAPDEFKMNTRLKNRELFAAITEKIMQQIADLKENTKIDSRKR